MKKTILSLALISLIFISLSGLLYQRQKDLHFANKTDRICLNGKTDPVLFKQILLKNGYVKDAKDADLVSEWLIDTLFKHRGYELTSLRSLNGRDYQIPIEYVKEKGGIGFAERLEISNQRLGLQINDSLSNIQEQTTTGDLTISVKIKKEEKSLIQQVKAVVLGDKTKSISERFSEHFLAEDDLSNIDVQLKKYEIINDSLHGNKNVNEKIVCIGKTNKEGLVTFDVDPNGFYSILPTNEGFEYGTPKGTSDGKPIQTKCTTTLLGKVKSPVFTFIQRERRMKIFDESIYSHIKADDSFCVRTINDFLTEIVKTVVLYLLVWWFVFFALRHRDNKLAKLQPSKYNPVDYTIVGLLMILNGVCLLSMLAIVNPAVDRSYASEMTTGTMGGCIALLLFSRIDFVKYYTKQYNLSKRFCYFNKLIDGGKSSLKALFPQKYKDDIERFATMVKNSNTIPRGIGFLSVSFLLVIALALFGSSPEGSTAKVNLNIGILVQPSEISKFFFVAAIAMFFTANAKRIQVFSESAQLGKQIKTMGGIGIAIIVLLLFYVGAISDMGPALVLVVTFIIMYSIVRRDLPQMLIGVSSYIGMLWIVHSTLQSNIQTEDKAENELIIVLLLSLLWYAIWFGGSFLTKKKIFESAGIMNLLILLFTQGGQIMKQVGLVHQGQRLEDRIAMSGDGIWDNAVKGGDQIAQGIWGLAGGGFFGQGIGKGNANLIPAFHTDMIYESIGEVMGFGVLVIILACYACLIMSCLKRAKETGHPFLFYMIAGVGIVTEVQTFVILLGSLGIVPLTGVSLPLLSYGKSGLVVNLAAFGIVLGMSRNKATITQKQSIAGYNSIVRSCLIVFVCLFGIVSAYTFNYQVLNRDAYLVKTAKVTNLLGEYVPEHNPRIDIIFRKIRMGNVYDRNGLLLATSEVKDLEKYREEFVKAGVWGHDIDSLQELDLKRYYPFGNHTLFMVGDINTNSLTVGANDLYARGYLTDIRNSDFLHGFPMERDTIPSTKVILHSQYVPRDTISSTSYPFAYHKNEDIIKMLKDGTDGELVKQFNDDREKRDIHLTIDAKLQIALQSRMIKAAEKDDDVTRYDLNDNSRVSIVLLNSSNGELLCSANYPLPDQDVIEYINAGKTNGDFVLPNRYTTQDLGLTWPTYPGSTAKVMSATAGFMKQGISAKDIRYDVNSMEIIDKEPTSTKGVGVSMQDAIIHSSNCYFINSVHCQRLYSQLDTIYQYIGINIEDNNIKPRNVFATSTYPFIFNTKYTEKMNSLAQVGYDRYDNYINERTKGHYRNMGPNFQKKGVGRSWQIAWGQKEIKATPLNMARVASMVSNGGVVYNTVFVKDSPTGSHVVTKDTKSMETLKAYMIDAVNIKYTAISDIYKNDKICMGGKTGTPQRGSNPKIEDGWFMCFLNTDKGNIALAIRVENCKSMSTDALHWLNKVVLPTLKEQGYIN